jgi:hypothetical protein
MKKYILILVISFLSVGYYFSEIRQFQRLIKENNISTPKDVYDYLGRVTGKPDSSTGVIRNCTPYYLLTKRKNLWCDEGAIVMAWFDQILGYDTRLVNIIGMDNISHHTVLEVFENGKWTIYDRLYDHFNVPIDSTVTYKVLKRGENPYPTWYQHITMRNFFLQKIALLLRGIKQ